MVNKMARPRNLGILFLFATCMCDQELKHSIRTGSARSLTSLMSHIFISVTLSWSGTNPNPESITTTPFPLSHHYTLG